MSRYKVFVYALLCLAVIAAAQFAWGKDVQEEPLAVESNTEYILRDMTVKKDIYYTACRHLCSENEIADDSIINRSFAELEAEGWYIFRSEDGEICLFAEAEGLCPEDATKYHIVRRDGKLVIVHGPKGYNGATEGSLTVHEEELPPSWQKMLNADGIEFSDRDALLTALESLDEL